MEVIILDTEYYINFAANTFVRGLVVSEIHAFMAKRGLPNEEIFLVIQAGRLLANDWEFADEDEPPTKPDMKSPVPLKGR